MSSLPPFDRPLRILHLEDNVTDRALIHDRLQQGGLACDFRSTVTQQEFEAALAETAYDLILSDFTLPSYDGATALALAQRVRPGVPFLFVSGTIGEDRAVESLKSGATDYVLKNNLARLLPAVRRALREAAERAARRQAEEALRTAEARLREMAETIRDVFWVTSPDGRQLLYLSNAYAQIWGRPVEEAYARPTSWLESVHPDDRPKVLAALQQLAQGTEYRIEYRVIRPDGTERTIEDRRYPVRGEGGGVERSVGMATDITDRRQLEEQLRQAQKMEAIGQLAGGIAHDFNNMLTVINGRAQLLMNTAALPRTVTDSLREIYVAGGRAAGLTHQLLMFSRKHLMHRTALDLNELIDVLVQMLRRMIGEDIALDVRPTRPLPPISADASMLEQVLLNLAVNARDAMPRGGRLTITTELQEITDDDRLRNPEAEPGPHVCLRVRDIGCGMAPETRARIFEPFFTTKDVGKGTGLGLSTVFGIVKHHHGWIEVDSAVGEGTEFRAYFPVATTELAPGRAEIAPRDILGGQETILLVEDEAPVRELAKLVLQEYGYRVLSAGSGMQALEVWKWHAERIALLLTDLVMPDDMSGIELAEKLRAEKPSLKVVYTSGYSAEANKPGFGALQSARFLHKPYQPTALAQIVRDTLDQSGSHPPMESVGVSTPSPPPMKTAPAEKNLRILIIDDNRSIHEDFKKILIGENATGLTATMEAGLFGAPTAPRRALRFEVDSAYQGKEDMEMASTRWRRAGPTPWLSWMCGCRPAGTASRPPPASGRWTPRSRSSSARPIRTIRGTTCRSVLATPTGRLSVREIRREPRRRLSHVGSLAYSEGFSNSGRTHFLFHQVGAEGKADAGATFYFILTRARDGATKPQTGSS